jgi:hypothetical protein
MRNHHVLIISIRHVELVCYRYLLMHPCGDIYYVSGGKVFNGILLAYSVADVVLHPRHAAVARYCLLVILYLCGCGVRYVSIKVKVIIKSLEFISCRRFKCPSMLCATQIIIEMYINAHTFNQSLSAYVIV